MDKHLPYDTLFIVFEEDFRFYPEGQDPEGCDRYAERVDREITRRGFQALRGLAGCESPPPQSPSPSPARGKGKGKPKPESRLWTCWTRRSVDFLDEEEGFSSNLNLADLVRWASVGNLVWVSWCLGELVPALARSPARGSWMPLGHDHDLNRERGPMEAGLLPGRDQGEGPESPPPQSPSPSP